jgi:hypothetical protein
MAKESLSWKHCVDMCTGGTRSFIAHVKTNAPVCISSHCIIHRQDLAAKKKIPNALKTVSDDVKIVHFIKPRR